MVPAAARPGHVDDGEVARPLVEGVGPSARPVHEERGGLDARPGPTDLDERQRVDEGHRVASGVRDHEGAPVAGERQFLGPVAGLEASPPELRRRSRGRRRPPRRPTERATKSRPWSRSTASPRGSRPAASTAATCRVFLSKTVTVSVPVSVTKPINSTSGNGGTAALKAGRKPNPLSSDCAYWRERVTTRARARTSRNDRRDPHRLGRDEQVRRRARLLRLERRLLHPEREAGVLPGREAPGGQHALAPVVLAGELAPGRRTSGNSWPSLRVAPRVVERELEPVRLGWEFLDVDPEFPLGVERRRLHAPRRHLASGEERHDGHGGDVPGIHGDRSGHGFGWDRATHVPLPFRAEERQARRFDGTFGGGAPEPLHASLAGGKK